MSHSQIIPSTIKEGKLIFLLNSLLKNPTFKPLQQLHSLTLTTGSLSNSLTLFNTLLRHYSLSNSPQNTLSLYKQLQPLNFNISFNSFTYTFLINAITNSSNPKLGIQLHSIITKMGFQNHLYVMTSLLNLYVSSGVLGESLSVFDEMPDRNSVSWNVMISGLAKWGELEFARKFFDEMPDKNVVSWTAIIDGCVRLNRFCEGFDLFRRMCLCEGIRPSEITILAILPAVSNLGELKFCWIIHCYAEKRGFNTFDIRVANSFIDCYAKCGCVVSARRFFEEISLHRKNLVSWTSIISGFAMYGMGKEAVKHFVMMENAGLKPNRVTFLSVLNACSHGGLVEEGLKFFKKMVNEYQISLDIKHYGCLIDMLGRTGRLDEAEKMALSVPKEIANDVIWRTLLGACGLHGNVEMGERVTRKIMEVEKEYGGDYVLMHNIFSGVGRYEEAERLRKLMDKRNVFKLPGCSLI